MKYACIARHRHEHRVRLMCEVLEVSPAGFYAAQRRAPCRRAVADASLLAHVRRIHGESGATYGAPRIQRELRDDGRRVGTKRVARLMRADGLQGRAPHRCRPRTTDSRHDLPIAPNLLNRQFDVNGVALNQVWVGDITYVPTQEGWLYLATVLDLASRRCVGWAMHETLDAEPLVVRALDMAVARRRPPRDLVFHSDRGTQYCSAVFRERLTRAAMIASMSRKGDCWDNAVAESFFATLELELFARHRWATRAAARGAIFHFIEGWYNRKRRHSTLGYRSPAVYEAELQDAA